MTGEIGEYWRDVRDHRRHQKERLATERQECNTRSSSPPDKRRRRCYDWIIV